MSTIEFTSDVDPSQAAADLAAAHADDPSWLDAFSTALINERSANQAKRIFEVWGINHSEAGRLFGVTRQAVGRWVNQGVPATHVVTFGDLAAATDILSHYVRSDRISTVVRRPAPALNEQSLIDLIAQGRSADIVNACTAMFQFANVGR